MSLRPRAPFRLDLTAWALRRRPHNATDSFANGTYRRALGFPDGACVVSVRQSGPPRAPVIAVDVIGRPRGRAAEREVRATVTRLLGLDADLGAFARLARDDPFLGPLATRLRGLKPPRFASVFEALVNAIACQQLSLEVGIHLLNRLLARYGQPAAGASADAPADAGPTSVAGTRVFPTAPTLAEAGPAALRAMGFSAAKARALVGAARAVAAGELDLEGLQACDQRAALERLVALPGVGRWSAEYVLLRGLGRLDVFPGDDVGARNKLERSLAIERKLDYAAVGALLERWRPYAGMVYFHLLIDSLDEAGALSAVNEPSKAGVGVAAKNSGRRQPAQRRAKPARKENRWR